jgi:hypothetical protein
MHPPNDISKRHSASETVREAEAMLEQAADDARSVKASILKLASRFRSDGFHSDGEVVSVATDSALDELIVGMCRNVDRSLTAIGRAESLMVELSASLVSNCGTGSRLVPPLGIEDESDVEADSPCADQRANLRRKLMQLVHLAPFVDGTFPGSDDFEAVKGYDISEAGIAFYLSHPPTHEEYVVVLGSVLRPIYVRARVVRVAQKQMYLVGCRFVGRLQPPAEAPSRAKPHAAHAGLSVH